MVRWLACAETFLIRPKSRPFTSPHACNVISPEVLKARRGKKADGIKAIRQRMLKHTISRKLLAQVQRRCWHVRRSICHSALRSDATIFSTLFVLLRIGKSKVRMASMPIFARSMQTTNLHTFARWQDLINLALTERGKQCLPRQVSAQST